MGAAHNRKDHIMTIDQKNELDGLRCGLDIIVRLVDEGTTEALEEARDTAARIERELFDWQCTVGATLLAD